MKTTSLIIVSCTLACAAPTADPVAARGHKYKIPNPEPIQIGRPRIGIPIGPYFPGPQLPGPIKKTSPIAVPIYDPIVTTTTAGAAGVNKAKRSLPWVRGFPLRLGPGPAIPNPDVWEYEGGDDDPQWVDDDGDDDPNDVGDGMRKRSAQDNWSSGGGKEGGAGASWSGSLYRNIGGRKNPTSMNGLWRRSGDAALPLVGDNGPVDFKPAIVQTEPPHAQHKLKPQHKKHRNGKRSIRPTGFSNSHTSMWRHSSLPTDSTLPLQQKAEVKPKKHSKREASPRRGGWLANSAPWRSTASPVDDKLSAWSDDGGVTWHYGLDNYADDTSGGDDGSWSDDGSGETWGKKVKRDASPRSYYRRPPGSHWSLGPPVSIAAAAANTGPIDLNKRDLDVDGEFGGRWPRPEDFRWTYVSPGPWDDDNDDSDGNGSWKTKRSEPEKSDPRHTSTPPTDDDTKHDNIDTTNGNTGARTHWKGSMSHWVVAPEHPVKNEKHHNDKRGFRNLRNFRFPMIPDDAIYNLQLKYQQGVALAKTKKTPKRSEDSAKVTKRSPYWWRSGRLSMAPHPLGVDPEPYWYAEAPSRSDTGDGVSHKRDLSRNGRTTVFPTDDDAVKAGHEDQKKKNTQKKPKTTNRVHPIPLNKRSARSGWRIPGHPIIMISAAKEPESMDGAPSNFFPRDAPAEKRSPDHNGHGSSSDHAPASTSGTAPSKSGGGSSTTPEKN